jgi:two-component system, OmpR family, KDP operon response regulator KdpE
MEQTIELDAIGQGVRGTSVSLDYDPYFLSPDHKLRVLNHKPKSTHGPKVLIIDDDLDLCLGLRIRLRASYDTYVANDAGSGLGMALTEMPDVIILDIGLPDYDGYFVLQSLSEIAGLAGVPVIVLTGRDQLFEELRCLEAGAKLFFQKPIDSRSLSAAIEQLVG